MRLTFTALLGLLLKQKLVLKLLLLVWLWLK